MKILVSTNETQGAFEDDFFRGSAGEIVTFPTFVCAAYPSSCGCDRAWGGIDSHRGSTTAIVAETDLTERELVERVHQFLVDGGWALGDETGETREWARQLAGDVLAVAAEHEVGTVLGVHTLVSDNDVLDGVPPREIILRRKASAAL